MQNMPDRKIYIIHRQYLKICSRCRFVDIEVTSPNVDRHRCWFFNIGGDFSKSSLAIDNDINIDIDGDFSTSIIQRLKSTLAIDSANRHWVDIGNRHQCWKIAIDVDFLFNVWMIIRMIDWLINWLNDWLIEWMNEWMILFFQMLTQCWPNVDPMLIVITFIFTSDPMAINVDPMTIADGDFPTSMVIFQHRCLLYPITPLNGACTVKRIFKDLGIQKWWKKWPT